MAQHFNQVMETIPMASWFQDPWVTAVYIGIPLALIFLWANRGLSVFVAVISTYIAFISSQLSLEALPYLGGMIFLGLLYQYVKALWLKFPLALGILGLIGAACFHMLPGFEPYVLIKSTQLSQDAYPMHLIYHFDKPLLILMGCWFLAYPIPHTHKPVSAFKWGIGLGGLCSLTLIGLALYFNYVRLDLKFPPFSGYWVAYNLFIVCVSEELLFRGLILRRLRDFLKPVPLGAGIALLISSVIFALAHYPGGEVYMLLSGTAGLFYGIAYLKTEKLSASILVHFMLNSVHFFAFSYPALR